MYDAWYVYRVTKRTFTHREFHDVERIISDNLHTGIAFTYLVRI